MPCRTVSKGRCIGESIGVGSAAVSGFLVGLSLILAIGAQNAFVLRQGLRREHVGAVVLACGLSDAVLMTAGVLGFDVLSDAVPWLGGAMRFGGAAFLIVYGALRFRAALRGGEALMPTAATAAPLGRVLATCLLLTWANPHVYLDTLVLVRPRMPTCTVRPWAQPCLRTAQHPLQARCRPTPLPSRGLRSWKRTTQLSRTTGVLRLARLSVTHSLPS